jgi:hypothetical protein
MGQYEPEQTDKAQHENRLFSHRKPPVCDRKENYKEIAAKSQHVPPDIFKVYGRGNTRYTYKEPAVHSEASTSNQR